MPTTAGPTDGGASAHAVERAAVMPAVNQTPEPSPLRALQRRAGNSAVDRLLQPAGRAGVARFVGSEHKDLGDSTHTTIDLGGGVVVSWGDIVALAGDEYATPEDLLADTKTADGKARLRAALEHDGIPGSLAATLPAPTAAQRAAHDAKYITLAMNNTSHFPDGGAAINAWAGYHAIAIETAVLAGLSNNPAGQHLAYTNEAFGEHFLTDCFSGGHIRTPRSQIVDWYSNVFAPRVAQPLVDNLIHRLVEALVLEASPQTSVPDSTLRSRISARVNAGIAGAITAMGGMATLTSYIGLGIAGAISGAIHDKEGEDGVMVASEDHPAPWRAYGDTGLKKSPVSGEQATKAIAAAKGQVDLAYTIGEGEGVTRDTVPAAPPARVHFGFNSSSITGDAVTALTTAAAYMTYRPESTVEITGHTDPIGNDAANDALGQARAEAVAVFLMARRVEPTRLTSKTMGERALVTNVPRLYAENRRADLVWGTGAVVPGGSSTSDADLATNRAMATAQAKTDPAAVLRFVPHTVEEIAGAASVAGGNAPLPDWHWGKLDASFRAVVDDWIRGMVGTKLEKALDDVPALDPQTETVPITGTVITVHPRDQAKLIVRALMAAPTAELGGLTGTPAGP